MHYVEWKTGKSITYFHKLSPELQRDINEDRLTRDFDVIILYPDLSYIRADLSGEFSFIMGNKEFVYDRMSLAEEHLWEAINERSQA